MANEKKTQAQTQAQIQAPVWTSVLDMPLTELESRVTQAGKLMAQILDLFPGVIVMPEAERKVSNGRLRNGEGGAYLTLITVMEAFPALFEGLADLDQGVDPTHVETPLMRDRIQRAELLARFAAVADKLGGVSDTVLHLRSLVREPMSEAYGIAKSMAKTNQKLKSMLAPVLDFYAAIAKVAAATRKANAEAKAAADAADGKS
jgi:hypothetical protein